MNGVAVSQKLRVIVEVHCSVCQSWSWGWFRVRFQGIGISYILILGFIVYVCIVCFDMASVASAHSVKSWDFPAAALLSTSASTWRLRSAAARCAGPATQCVPASEGVPLPRSLYWALEASSEVFRAQVVLFESWLYLARHWVGFWVEVRG
jgi:hypothetical protein